MTDRVRIADGNDDAEEHLAEDNSIDLGSSDLEIGAEGGGEDAQLIGLRFLDIAIPGGATINSANIQFTVDETDNEVQTLPIEIFGELGEALTFTSSAGDISSRTRTGPSVNWENIPEWSTAGEAGPGQQTPDIAPVIQAIVNQPTWTASDALVIMLGGRAFFERTAESFNGDASAAALLTIDFDPLSVLTFGDFNADGTVDSVDAQILADNFRTGTSFEQGDNNFDGRVDLRDFLEFRELFNVQGAAAAAVPEPGSLALLSVAGGALVLAARRRRR